MSFHCCLANMGSDEMLTNSLTVVAYNVIQNVFSLFLTFCHFSMMFLQCHSPYIYNSQLYCNFYTCTLMSLLVWGNYQSVISLNFASLMFPLPSSAETPVIFMVDLFTVSHMLLMLLSVFCILTYLHFTLYIFSDLFSINSLFSCFLYYLNHYIKFLVLDIVFFFFQNSLQDLFKHISLEFFKLVFLFP